MNFKQILSVFSVAVFLILFSLAKCDVVEVEDCGNNLPKPARVNVAGCSQPPCEFPQGSNVDVNITFMVQEDYNVMQAGVNAKVNGVTVPFILPQSNACEALVNNRCPLEAGEIVTYKMVLPILEVYPAIDAEVTFKMHRDVWQLQAFFCFKIAAKIVVP